MEEIFLYKDEDYTMSRHEGFSDEAMDFLDKVAWGNDGAVYEHKNTEEHIRRLYRPTLITIRRHDKIHCTAVFCNTPIMAGLAKFNCYYIRYFAASNEIRGKGLVKKFGVKVMEVVRETEKEKTIFFACIEKGNRASYRSVENAGYENIGVIKTNGFSRFFPKANKNIEQVNTDTVRHEVLLLLKKQFKEYALTQFNSIFLDDNYYIIRQDGEIIAGCQLHRAHWVIKKMAGFMGKVVMSVVPVIPILNKLFNPKRFEFLAFEGIYVKPGYENQLMYLFEGLLARENLKSAMYWLGENCPLRTRILEKGKTGLIHSFIKHSDVFIMASFHDLSNAEISNIKSRPLFASGFDYI